MSSKRPRTEVAAEDQVGELRLQQILWEAVEASLIATGHRTPAVAAGSAEPWPLRERCTSLLQSVAANLLLPAVSSAPSPSVAPPQDPSPPRPSMAAHYRQNLEDLDSNSPDTPAAEVSNLVDDLFSPGGTGIIEVVADGDQNADAVRHDLEGDGRWPAEPLPLPLPFPPPPPCTPPRARCSRHGKLRSFRNLENTLEGYCCRQGEECVMGSHSNRRAPPLALPVSSVVSDRPTTCPDGPLRICSRFLREMPCHFSRGERRGRECRYSHSVNLRSRLWAVMLDHETDID